MRTRKISQSATKSLVPVELNRDVQEGLHISWRRDKLLRVEPQWREGRERASFTSE